MELPTRIPVGRWRAGLHDRRLSGLRPDDAEPGQARERASPVEAVRRGHDERPADARRSEEHTSELQSLTISYAVFCLKKKKKTKNNITTRNERIAHLQ